MNCSKGFFDIFWNGMMASLQNLGKVLQKPLFYTWLVWKEPIITIIAVMKNLPGIFYYDIFQNQISKFFKAMPSFHFKKYWTFLRLDKTILILYPPDLKLLNQYCHSTHSAQTSARPYSTLWSNTKSLILKKTTI